eukprot:gene12286-5869_t
MENEKNEIDLILEREAIILKEIEDEKLVGKKKPTKKNSARKRRSLDLSTARMPVPINEKKLSTSISFNQKKTKPKDEFERNSENHSVFFDDKEEEVVSVPVISIFDAKEQNTPPETENVLLENEAPEKDVNENVQKDEEEPKEIETKTENEEILTPKEETTEEQEEDEEVVYINQESREEELEQEIETEDDALYIEEEPLENCEICDERSITSYCPECQAEFCDICFDSHHKPRRMKTHTKLNPVDGKPLICKKHNKPCDFYCHDDKIQICTYCALTEHKTHDFGIIKEILLQFKKELKAFNNEELLTSLENDLEKIKLDIIEKERELQELRDLESMIDQNIFESHEMKKNLEKENNFQKILEWKQLSQYHLELEYDELLEIEPEMTIHEKTPTPTPKSKPMTKQRKRRQSKHQQLLKEREIFVDSSEEEDVFDDELYSFDEEPFSSKEVLCCGRTHLGQLGIDSKEDKLKPIELSLSNVKSLAGAESFTVAVLNNGSVRQWGQLGKSPENLSISDVVSVKCGRSHTVALLKNGDLLSWGSNTFGQLGLGHTTNCSTPQKINISKVKQIECCYFQSLALLTDGTVWGFGCNNLGQLGIANTIDQNTPQKLNLSNIKQISCGGCHAYAIADDGSVYGWGFNNSGQLGGGTPTYCEIIPQYLRMFNVKKIVCGMEHTLAVLDNGTLYSWGNNSCGQLGLGNKPNQKTPQKVEIMNVKDIACHGYQSFALLEDNSVYAWGANKNGQLGLGSTDQQDIPQPLEIKDVKKITCSPFNTYFLQ